MLLEKRTARVWPRAAAGVGARDRRRGVRRPIQRRRCARAPGAGARATPAGCRRAAAAAATCRSSRAREPPRAEGPRRTRLRKRLRADIEIQVLYTYYNTYKTKISIVADTVHTITEKVQHPMKKNSKKLQS